MLAEIKALRDALATLALPKSPVGDAVRYLTNQWDARQRYVDDGRLAIDNNRAENQLRVIAYAQLGIIARIGSSPAASTAPRGRALLYSLVQRCTLVGLSPFTYLKDVLLRVATHPHQRLDQLTPRSWAATLTGTAVRRHDGVCRTHTRTFPESDSGWAAPSDANTSISAIDCAFRPS